MIFWRNRLFGCFLLTAFCLPQIASADGFVMLVGIPGLDSNTVTDTSSYITALYNLSIWIAAFLAVIKIIFAGVQYMFSDLVTSKENAKKDIQGAILGLIIVLAAVLILETINPNLTNFTLFKDVPTPIVNPVPSGKVTEGVPIGPSSPLDRQALLKECTNGQIKKQANGTMCCTSPSATQFACAAGTDVDSVVKVGDYEVFLDKVYTSTELAGLIEGINTNGGEFYGPAGNTPVFENEMQARCTERFVTLTVIIRGITTKYLACVPN